MTEPHSPSLFDRIMQRVTHALPLFALAVVASFAIRRLDDFDTWWHLASGRWIARHHAIPHTDVLSFTVPNNEWINLQWLYDLLLYGMWNTGGANGLVLLSAACFVATFALLARHLRRFLGPIASALLLGWIAATVNERFLIRPEMATFPLLAATQLVLADGRRRPECLRWLVVLMLLWTNMHSLFILGVGAILCAISGAIVAELPIPILPAAWRRDSAWPAASRRALFVWGGAGLAATIVNPYLFHGIAFPFELMSRIDGSSGVYSAIGEFRPPFSGYFQTFAIGSYQVFVLAAAALAVVAGILRALSAQPPASRTQEPDAVASRGGFDVGALVFAAVLAWLSLLARRNVGVFVIGAAPFVGACIGIVLERLSRAFGPAPRAAIRVASMLVVAGALTLCGFVVTNHWYAMGNETHEFGLGVFESNFQPRATAFFREQKLPGPAYDDETAGGYLTWDEPTGKGVYIDGRLEVYDTPFFAQYMQNLGNMQAWQKDADARGIQSAIVFHRWGNRKNFLRMLMTSSQWRIVYYDEVVAIFVRAGANDDRIQAAQTAFMASWRQKTLDALSAPARTFSWQWSIDRYIGQITYAQVLETIGDPRSALQWYEHAIVTGMPTAMEINTRHRSAELHEYFGEPSQARMHLLKAAELDPSDQATRAMLTRLDSAAKP